MSSPDVVVTGAGGVLGQLVLRALQAKGISVLGLGRGEAPAEMARCWAKIDLLDADALRAILPRGASVVHAASEPLKPGADVRAASALAQAAQQAGIAHIVYVQIAGIGEAAQSASVYYRDKVLAGQRLQQGSVPCSTVAATQFHELIDRVFRTCSLGPLLILPPFRLQPVDAAFVAERLADHVRARETEHQTICGPETLSSREMARAWIMTRGGSTLTVPAPGIGLLSGLARIQPVQGVSGGRSWREWLGARAPERKLSSTPIKIAADVPKS